MCKGESCRHLDRVCAVRGILCVEVSQVVGRRKACVEFGAHYRWLAKVLVFSIIVFVRLVSHMRDRVSYPLLCISVHAQNTIAQTDSRVRLSLHHLRCESALSPVLAIVSTHGGMKATPNFLRQA